MDDMDRRILELLENNGRLSHEKIGKRFNMSRPAIHQRVSRLEQNKTIKGYNSEIDCIYSQDIFNNLEIK